MTGPVTVTELLERNNVYASKHTPLEFISELESAGGSPPSVVVVACADPRAVPETFLNLKPPEVVVLRTAGGRVQPVLDDLIYLDGLLSLKNIMVIHHNDCGESKMTEDEAHDALKKRFPGVNGADSIEFGTFKDITLEQSVKEDISLLRQSPFLPKELVESAVGFTYDIKTGKLTPVQ